MKGLIRESVEQMAGYVPGEQPEGCGVIKLNTNENPYPPSSLVTKALWHFGPGRLRFYPDPVAANLRRRLAEVHACGERNVLVGNGSDEILSLCARVFVENNGSIGYPQPSYSLYPVLAEARGIEKRPVPLDDDFRFSPPSDLATSLFFLANPNAPTGLLSSPEQVRQFAASLPGVLVIDEAYADFARENCMALALEMDNVLVLRTLSKSYSLAGLRVGYAVGHEALIEALLKVKDSYNIDALSQRLALAALDDRDHMLANVAAIKSTRKTLSDALMDMGWEVLPSEANFVWAKPKAKQAKECFESLRNVNILVRYFEGDRTGDYLRITVGTDDETECLLEALRDME